MEWCCRRAHLVAALAVSALALSACGDGGGVVLTPGGDDDNPPSDCTATTCGEILIGLTDADGDFLSYAVDIVSIELEHSDGSTVETLPETQRVDFADLVDVTEFVTAVSIPNGTYVGANVRLDYREAEVTVEVAGLPTGAVVVDEIGDTLEVFDIEIELDSANEIVVAPGAPALLQLDFDLAATHAVNLLTTPVTAILDLVLVASIEPVDAREFRVRGPLVSVDETAGSYVIELRPFNHPDAEHGRITVLTDVDTAFEVDGDELDDAAGLAALADLGADTLTVAHGVYDIVAREFTADRVLAGDSVPGADFDVVIGNVAGRIGNALTVRGGTVIRTDDSVVYARGDIEVQLGSGTDVTQEGGSGTPLGIDAISVGQRIQAFGDASSSNFNPTLDASPGRVRLQLTRLTGTVVDATTGQIDLELFSIDGRDPQFFDYDDTGSSLLTDANPFDYEIDTGNLDVGDFDVGDPARAFGFVSPFGSAPPAFEARTLVDFEEFTGLLRLGWGSGGTATPFLSSGSGGFVLDGANPTLDARRFLEFGPLVFNVTTLGAPLSIEPPAAGRTVYAVSRARRVEVFRDFADFADRVNSLLFSGSTLHALTARGTFDEPSTTLTVHSVTASFRSP